MAHSSNGLSSVFGSNSVEFVLHNESNKVTCNELDAKIIVLYFAASSCPHSSHVTPILIEAYNDLLSSQNNFQVILFSLDENEDDFEKLFSTMPWLALPYFNKNVCDHVKSLYAITETPQLVILDQNGHLISSNGLPFLFEFGSAAYPFTSERINQLRDEEEMNKKNQTLESVLATPTRDYLISNQGKLVPISELKGKIVGVYMSIGSFRTCRNFTPELVEVYRKLKERGESFEIVYVSSERDEEAFKKEFNDMPWLAIPYGDKSLKRLPVYFKMDTLPTLLILGPDGKTLCHNARDYVAEFGTQAYPFTPEKLAAFHTLISARDESQTLESLLVSNELDFLIGKDNKKVPVSELVGKTILFYFSRKICPPCRIFTPKLTTTYNEIKTNHPDFEVIFVSLDNDEESFTKYYSEMPWLALPYNDKREGLIRRTFKSKRIPHLAAIGPDGKTLNNEAKELVLFMGSEAYPFDESAKKQMDRKLKEMAEGWPDKVRNKKHAEHELVLGCGGVYSCFGCHGLEVGWVYSCGECRFQLHPGCAMTGNVEDDHVYVGGDGFICDGNVCRNA